MDTSYLLNRDFRTRVWSRIKVGNPSECWPCISNSSKPRHQQIGYAGKLLYVHRLAYEFSYGPVPEGKKVMHTCDNPPCCNPNHLRAGTQAENLRDMVEKGRDRKARKLSDKQIQEITDRYLAGENPKEYAVEYGVTYRTVMKYIRGERRADALTAEKLARLKAAAFNRRGGRGRWSDYAIK